MPKSRPNTKIRARKGFTLRPPATPAAVTVTVTGDGARSPESEAPVPDTAPRIGKGRGAR